jgi:glycosyltransferase involved in cell wall biosynthesis
MLVEIINNKASSILHDGKFYDTGKPLDLSFSDAYRLTRIANVKASYDSVEYDPALWRDEKFVNFYGDIDGVSGFGGVSQNLIKFSTKIKTALIGKVYGVRDHQIFAAQNRPMNQKGAMIWHDQPREPWLYTPFKKNIAIIPWETTVVPRSWIGKINGMDALLVPCKQNKEAFAASGVKIPIDLIHWGVDEELYYPLERPERPTFTFGHLGALSIRKGTDLLIKAFQEAFPKEITDVRLICKSSYNTYPFDVKDKRITVYISTWPHADILSQFYKQIDCFVFPTRGEGFGLTPLEAMATGVPVIVTGWSGPLEYMTPEVGWLIDHTLSPAKNFSDIIYKEDCGNWAEPSKDHLVELMRYAYNHRDEVKAKGIAAAKYVKENWLWSQKIPMYEVALEKHL